MIQERSFEITFTYKGKVETRIIYWMHVAYLRVKDFYRIPGKLKNFDIYKKEGVWCNVLPVGLSEYLLQLVGNAIDEAESKR